MGGPRRSGIGAAHLVGAADGPIAPAFRNWFRHQPTQEIGAILQPAADKVDNGHLGALLLASVVYFQARLGIWTAHELLISLFLFITAPFSANMIAKVHLHRVRVGAISEPDSIAGAPPRPGGEGDWATFEAPKRDNPASTANT